MLKKWALAAICCIVLPFSSIVPAFAADNGPNFTVEPVYPENQREHTGYFDLRVTPGETQEIYMTVTNSADKALTVEVEAVNASTAPGGFIDYATSGVRDESMRYAFEDIASVTQSLVTIPPGEQGQVAVTLQAPEEPFDGMILGGVRILKLEEEESDEMIVNAYQYAMAVILTANDNEVRPDFELVDISTGLENYRAAVTATIRNTQPAAAREVEVRSGLYQEGQSEPFFQLDKTVRIAPNSVWECQYVDQAGYGFQPGNYAFRMRMELDGQVWEFDQDFVISDDEANGMNSNAVNQQPVSPVEASQGVPAWVYITCALGLLLLLALIVLLIVVLRKKKPSGL